MRSRGVLKEASLRKGIEKEKTQGCLSTIALTPNAILGKRGRNSKVFFKSRVYYLLRLLLPLKAKVKLEGNEEKPQKIQINQFAKEIRTKVLDLLRVKGTERIVSPGLDGALLSSSLFNELQSSEVSMKEVAIAYEQYKAKYENKRFTGFYLEHQRDSWFIEKYDPEQSTKLKNERSIQSQRLRDYFEKQLQHSMLKGLSLVLPATLITSPRSSIRLSYDLESEHIEEVQSLSDDINDFNIEGAPFFGFDPDRLTLFLYQLQKNISRWEILDLCRKQVGFLSFSVSEPLRNQGYSRFCWITFDTEENCELAREKLSGVQVSGDYKLNPIRSKSSSTKKIRVCPRLFSSRISEDIILTGKLIDQLNKENFIEV